jgi:hypothetical protein
MNWLTFEEIQAMFRGLVRRPAQMVTLFAEVSSLTSDIPVQSKQEPPGKGPPTAIRRWFGKIGDRLFEIQADASGILNPSAVVVYTFFLPAQDIQGDWSVLVDLKPLPRSIHVARPLFIESRCTTPQFVVYRPDPQGWSTPIYNAASSTDAEHLLAFMNLDGWNEGCFIDDPEPPGKWATIQGDEVILGTGSDLNSALRFACDLSSRNPSRSFQVKDISERNDEVYVVCDGRVLRNE